MLLLSETAGKVDDLMIGIREKRMNIQTHRAIGVFDSGIGGLTVVRSLMERLPFENIVYFGAMARVPYGIKSVETINRYALQITEFLLKKDVKLLIVACNTMAAVAYQAIRDLSPVPVLEVIEASAKTVSYTHLRAHETPEHLVCRLLLEKKKSY